MKWYRLVARLSHASFRFLKKLTNLLDALFSGFWLGVMGSKSLDYSDELYYNQTQSYSDLSYNESGFFKWEKLVIEKYFSNFKTILIIAAGGGREVLALSKMGFELDAYECNPKLMEFGNEVLLNNKTNNKIQPLKRNSVPPEIKKYDGIIIGWGAYSLMRNKDKRIGFIRSLKPFMKPESILMLSFIYATDRRKKDELIRKTANFFGFFRAKRQIWESGDRLVPNFIHYFTEMEIRSEIADAGYRLIEYNSKDYGWLTASI